MSRHITAWLLDSSTFINFMVINQVSLLVRQRKALCFPEYVYRVELGLNARESTRDEARKWISQGTITLLTLTVDDLDRVAQLDRPRRIGLGEIACAIIAERLRGGVLCDDWKARHWLSSRVYAAAWDTIEDVLLDAANMLEITEYDLLEFQGTLLRDGRYHCRFDLRIEFLQRKLHQ